VRTASTTLLPEPLVARSIAQARSQFERDARLLRGDQRLHGRHDVAAREVVRLDVVDGDLDAGLLRGDARIDDQPVGHLPQAHRDEVDDANVGPASQPARSHTLKNRTRNSMYNSAPTSTSAMASASSPPFMP
jgi:hypothetical protein